MSGASTAQSTKFVSSFRWIPEKGGRGSDLREPLLLGDAGDWAVGLDYRPLVDSVELNSTYRAISEDPGGWRPGIILGTSKEDFTDGGIQLESRAWFATASKALPKIEPLGDFRIAPYAGAVWIEEFDDLRPLAGVNIAHPIASLMVQYSGTDTHMTLSKSLTPQVSVSAIYWGLKYPGVGLRFRF